jgi:hypothetical protein
MLNEVAFLDLNHCKRLIKLVVNDRSPDLYEWMTAYLCKDEFKKYVKTILETEEEDTDAIGVALIALRDSEVSTSDKALILTKMCNTTYKEPFVYCEIARVLGHLCYHTSEPQFLDLLLKLREHTNSVVREEASTQLEDSYRLSEEISEKDLSKLLCYVGLWKSPADDMEAKMVYLAGYLSQHFNISLKGK